MPSIEELLMIIGDKEVRIYEMSKQMAAMQEALNGHNLPRGKHPNSNTDGRREGDSTVVDFQRKVPSVEGTSRDISVPEERATILRESPVFTEDDPEIKPSE